MDHFSISQLSRFSGIKPFTIRIWEKRYNALLPGRSAGNTRFYTNHQLRRLMNISSLMEFGHKASELCVLSDESLYKMVEQKQNQAGNEIEGYFIAQLIAAGLSYDESHFTNIFSHALLRFGIKDAYIKVIYPMLLRIGMMWSCDTIDAGHEHFISNLLRQKLLTAIDLLPPAKSADGTWLLFLPENEFHETGLLMAHYLIRLSGKKSVYLGSNVPLQSAAAAAKLIKPDNILLFWVHGSLPGEAQDYLENVRILFKGRKIHVSGAHLTGQVNPGSKIQVLQSIQQLEELLK